MDFHHGSKSATWNMKSSSNNQRQALIGFQGVVISLLCPTAIVPGWWFGTWLLHTFTYFYSSSNVRKVIIPTDFHSYFSEGFVEPPNSPQGTCAQGQRATESGGGGRENLWMKRWFIRLTGTIYIYIYMVTAPSTTRNFQRSLGGLTRRILFITILSQKHWKIQ